jgi:hypothetical protein
MSCRTIFQRCIVPATAAVILSIYPCSARTAETLYHFLDEKGVPHFSNHPLDPRYRPLAAAAGPGAAAPQAAPGPELMISAPDQAALGDMFEISLTLPEPAAATGYVELSFDPEALALTAISVEASVTEPGKVRIELKLDPAQPDQTLVSLSFQAVARQPTEASIQITQLELYRPGGEALPAHAGVSASVRLVE